MAPKMSKPPSPEAEEVQAVAQLGEGKGVPRKNLKNLFHLRSWSPREVHSGSLPRNLREKVGENWQVKS